MTPDAMAALHRRCFTLPPPWSAAAFRDTLRDPATIFHGAGDGFLLGRVIADEAELLTLAVAVDARRAGLGRRLVRAFHESARMDGASEAFLEVGADNLPARRLYLGEGYALAGRRRGYYRAPGKAPVDALILRVVLGAG